MTATFSRSQARTLLIGMLLLSAPPLSADAVAQGAARQTPGKIQSAEFANRRHQHARILATGRGAVCGNSVLEPGEDCDDGNASSGDGCSDQCNVESGWSCSLPVPAMPVSAAGDAGFEAGTPNPSWSESSTNFKSPLCTFGLCGSGGGSAANNGSWWAWFGGVDPLNPGHTLPENASLEQVVMLPATQPLLRMAVEQSSCDGPDDVLRVLLDGNQVFATTADDPACTQIGYRDIAIDLSAAPGGPYNDDRMHTLRLEASIAGTNQGISNFFVDDIVVEIGRTDPEPSLCTEQPATCFHEPFEQLAGDLAVVGWSRFELGALELGWGTTDDGVCGSGTWSGGNPTSGSGDAVCIDTDAAGSGQVDSYLCSPPFDLGMVSSPAVAFNLNYQVFSTPGPGDYFEVLAGVVPPDASSIAAFSSHFLSVSSQGNFGAPPGVEISAPLDSFAGEPAVWVCLRYGGDFDWYAVVDDFRITAASCPLDTDSDGLPDDQDNCSKQRNGPFVPDDGGNVQLDTDGDGIGNFCDPDIATVNGAGGPPDCTINFLDLAALRAAFFSSPASAHWNPDADLNGDQSVNFLDLGLLKERFLQAPGPSGIVNQCSP